MPKKNRSKKFKIMAVLATILIFANLLLFFSTKNEKKELVERIEQSIPQKLRPIKPFKISISEYIPSIPQLKNRYLPVNPFSSKFNAGLKKDEVKNSGSSINERLYKKDYQAQLKEWNKKSNKMELVPEKIKKKYPNGFEGTITDAYSKRFEPASQALLSRCKTVDGFDMPCGAPNGEGYYLAQIFGNKSNHLGEDWNKRTGGNTDLGDPVYAIADGAVYWSKINKGSWGNIIRLIHNVGTNENPKYIESFYAHLDTILVWEGQEVIRGQEIGTIGTAYGRYPAHLHFEIRKNINTPIGKGYTTDTLGFGYTQPLPYIEKRRPWLFKPE